MSKVSKNIKQLRTEKGMSQTELAEKLFVTRQAISSWENGRTQPDIQMLGKLRVIFDVSIEELLYGKKRNTELELQKPGYKGTLITVFSVMGSLLVELGLILIFAVAWEDIPEFFKSALAFVPFMAGTAAGVFCYIKKKDKKAWCEGGAIIWALGTITSSFLVNYAFTLNMSGSVFYITLTILLNIIMYLLKSISVLPVMYVCGLMGSFSCMDGVFWNAPTWKRVLFRIISFIVAALVFYVGILFRSILKKADKQSHRLTIASWLTAIAIPFFLIVELVDFSGEFAIIMIVSLTAVTYFILSQKYKQNTSPFTLGFIAMCGMMLFFGISCHEIGYIISVDNKDIIILSCFGLAVLIISLIHIKCRFQSKIHFSLLTVYLISQISFITMIFCIFIDNAKNVYSIIMPVLTMIFFSLIIADGAVRRKLTLINLGFIGFVVQLMFWIGASGFGMLTNGIVLLVCGVILLLVNLKISKEKEAITNQTNLSAK